MRASPVPFVPSAGLNVPRVGRAPEAIRRARQSGPGGGGSAIAAGSGAVAGFEYEHGHGHAQKGEDLLPTDAPYRRAVVPSCFVIV